MSAPPCGGNTIAHSLTREYSAANSVILHCARVYLAAILYRLRAGIVADRFLVKARSLASPASTTATHASTDATNVSDAVGAPTAVLESSAGDGDGKGIAAGDDSSKAQSSKAAGVADITAARAAAREAEEHYARADNNEGALKARRTEVALRGDKAMIAVASLLEQRCSPPTSPLETFQHSDVPNAGARTRIDLASALARKL